MSTHQPQCDAAILTGSWEALFAEAQTWSKEEEAAECRDPRPYFAENVVHLLQGRFAEAWRTHARCLEAESDIETVGAWVESLVDGQSDNSHVHLIRGLFLAQSGQSEESMASYKEAARLDPQSAYPHYFLAQIHQRANHLEMAIKEYKEAVRLNAAYVPARTNLGVAYQEQGRLEMAIKEYREVIKLQPNDPLAHANLGCALAEQGKMEPAFRSYKEAIKLNPNDAEVHFALGGL